MASRATRVGWWVGAVLAATFMAGFVAGTALSRRALTDASQAPLPPGMLNNVVDRMDLSPEQRNQVDAALRRWGTRTDAIMREAMSRVGVYVDSADREIRGILTDVQQAQFDSLLVVQRSQIRLRLPVPRDSAPPDGSPR